MSNHAQFRNIRLLKVLARRGGLYLIIIGLLIGIGGGFGAIGFRALIGFFRSFFFEGLGNNILGVQRGWIFLLPLIPALGGLIVGLIVYFGAKEAKGHGVPEVMSAVVRNNGIIRPRLVIIKALASAICIGSGGSAGREGPIVQIGSALGSALGQVLKVGRNNLNILVGCGAAAGIAATFNAPIAGVLFAMEVILRDFSFRTITPIIVSAVSATVLCRAFLGNHPAFSVPEYALVSSWEMVFYLGLGIMAGVFAVFFTRLLYKTEDIFEKILVPEYIKPVIGGLGIGIIGMFLPQIFGVGYETIEKAAHAQLAIQILLALVFVKIFATSMTLGTGGSGGIFAPSLFIGAMLGGLFGTVVHFWFPQITATSGAYAIVGMGALVAGTTHAPLCSILILFEMTDDYRIILPIMLAAIISSLVAKLIEKESIYTMKLSRRGERLSLGTDVSVLEQIPVSQVMQKDYDFVRENTTAARIMDMVKESKHTDFPVVDKDDRFMGMLGLHEVHGLIDRHELDNIVVAGDLIKPSDVFVTIDQTLADALAQFARTDMDELPVLDNVHYKRLLGLIDRARLMRHYQAALVRIR